MSEWLKDFNYVKLITSPSHSPWATAPHASQTTTVMDLCVLWHSCPDDESLSENVQRWEESRMPLHKKAEKAHHQNTSPPLFCVADCKLNLTPGHGNQCSLISLSVKEFLGWCFIISRSIQRIVTVPREMATTARTKSTKGQIIQQDHVSSLFRYTGSSDNHIFSNAWFLESRWIINTITSYGNKCSHSPTTLNDNKFLLWWCSHKHNFRVMLQIFISFGSPPWTTQALASLGSTWLTSTFFFTIENNCGASFITKG